MTSTCKRSSKNLNLKKQDFFKKNLLNIAKKNLLKDDFMTMKSCQWSWIPQINLKVENSKSNEINEEKKKNERACYACEKKKTFRQKLSID